ncbi:AAA family ATPase, partial [Streptomyces sp. NPDC055109]
MSDERCQKAEKMEYALPSKEFRSAFPIFGREEELDLFDRILKEVRSGGVIISGSIGIGKTRLAQEFCKRAEISMPLLGYAVCSAAAKQFNYGSISHFLLKYMSPDYLHRTSPEQLTEKVISATQTRVVAHVDNIELLDEASAVLLANLVALGRLFLISTVRKSPAALPPPLSLTYAGRAKRLHLGNLTASACLELSEEILRDPIVKSSASLLYKMSGGNPLFVREIVREARSAGTLIKRGKIWKFENDKFLAMPAALRQA